ncbi:unnamed protein product [Brassica rapa subsp. trilocularis]
MSKSDMVTKPETNIMHVSDWRGFYFQIDIYSSYTNKNVRRNQQQKQTSIVSNGRRSCLSMYYFS